MFRRLLLPFVFLLGASAAFAVTPVDKHGLLQVKDGQLSAADEKGGQPVQLRGMSLYWSQWGQGWWNESAIDQSVDWLGCEIIRAPIGVGDKDGNVTMGYLTSPAVAELHKARVRTVVEHALRRGIYVIIDWHDSTAQSHKKEAIAFFKQMATEYGNRPNVLFEIYNEPVNTSWADIKKYAEEMIGEIRGTPGYDGEATQNVIIVGTPNWSQLGSDVVNSPIDQPNLAYTLHFYGAYAPHFYNGGTSGLGKSFSDALDSGLCVMVTEWGTVMNDGSGGPDYDHSLEWVNAMEARKVTWLNWTINEKAEGASMFKVGTPRVGPWSDADLTPSGSMVKGWLPAPVAELSISPSVFNFSGKGESKSTTVLKGAATNVEIEVGADWLSATVGDSGHTIEITAAPNPSDADRRIGWIRVFDASGNAYWLKALQLPNDGNLAALKPATASSQEDAFAPGEATDGDETNTRWGSFFHKPTVPEDDPQWIYADLGQEYPIGKVVLVWEGAYSSHYQIQLAADGSDPKQDSSYVTVYDSGTVPSGKTDLTDTITDFSVGNPNDRIARYVRMYSFSRILPYGNSLYELKVYETPYIVPLFLPPVFAGGGGGSALVFSNVTWTVASDADWLTINPTSGGEDAPPYASEPDVSFTANLTGAGRTGNLTFTGGGVTATLAIMQPAQTPTVPGGSLSASLMGTLPADGSSGVTISVTSNSKWSATVVDPSWLTITSSASGSGNGSITLQATANNTQIARTGTVVFEGTGGLFYVVKVPQPPTTPAMGPIITVSPSTWAPSAKAQSIYTITVNSNVPWKATSNQPDWLKAPSGTGGQGSQFITLSVTENVGPARTGTVKIQWLNGTVPTVTLTVIQAAPPQAAYLTLGSSSWSSTSGNADSTTITVSSNVNWTATSGATSWLTVAPPDGSNSGSLTLSVTPNTGSATRTGTVTVVSSDGAHSASVAVSQSAQPNPPALAVTPTTWSAPGGGGSQTITITSNADWSASSNATWLTVSAPASASGNGSITLNANTNGEGATRTGTVTITGGGLSAQVTVTQAAAAGKVLQASPTSLTLDAAGGTHTVTVNSNIEWWAWDDTDWLNVTNPGTGKTIKGNGTLTFTASSNTGAQRKGNITIQGNGDNNQQITVVIPVTQSGASNDTWTPPAGGGQQLMMITRAGSWTAASSDTTWLTVTPTSGTGNASISLTASANAGPARAAAVIIVGGGATKTIQVSQAAVGQSLPTTLRITNSWPTGGPHGKGGYCADVIVTNNSSAAVDWKVTFALPEPGTIYDFWNAIWSQSGSQATAEGVAWNNVLPAGQSTRDVGFCANR